MTRLKPCPFCGDEAAYHYAAMLENEVMAARYDGAVGVHCKTCGVATLPFVSEEAAAEAWNKRVAE